MKIFNDLHVSVNQVFMKNLQENMSLITFETQFVDPNKISFLLNSLKKYDDSLKVIKTIIT